MASSICGTISRDRPGHARAAVDVGGAGLRAALVQQHDDGLDALGLQLAGVALAVAASSANSQPGDTGRGHDARRALEGHADEADLDALHLVDRRTAAAAAAGSAVTKALADRYWKSAPWYGSAGSAQPSTGWQPPFWMRSSSAGALVELVVADAGVVQADPVERLDGRLVVEGGRQQRRGADQVAGGDGQRVLLLAGRLELTDLRGEVLGATEAAVSVGRRSPGRRQCWTSRSAARAGRGSRSARAVGARPAAGREGWSWVRRRRPAHPRRVLS